MASTNTCRFHDLRQEHLAGAEEIAHDVHAVHERTLDDRERIAELEARRLRVGHDELVDAADQRLLQPLANRPRAPGVVLDALLPCLALVTAGDLEQPLGRIRPPRQDHVLDALAQVRVDLLVDRELARVHDAHAHSGADSVVQEHRVHRLAHGLVAPEGERHVAHAAAHQRVWARGTDLCRRFDEVERVAVVCLDAGRHREDVRVEDDVFGREPGLPGQDLVGTPADRYLALDRVGLALLVKRHDHDRSAVRTHAFRLLEERPLALLQADGVDDALALQALEPRLDHRPLRGIDHHRHARDVRLGGEQVQEAHHRAFRVEHALVHVDVDHLRAARDLLAGDVERARIVVGLDQAAELRRARHVGALADVHEQAVGPEVERLEAGEPAARLEHGGSPRRQARHGLRDVADVVRRGATAPAHDVHETARGVFLHEVGRLARRLVVFAEGVRQAGVGVRAHVRIGDARQFLDVRPELLRAERAVETNHRGAGVAHGIPERLDRLPGQRAAGGVGDRAGHHDRQVEAEFVEYLAHSEERRLGVQRVEDRLDQDQVHPALDECTGRFRVGRRQLVEADVAETRVAHVRRKRGRAVRGAERSRDEARAAGPGGHLVGGAARDLRGRQVQLAHQRFGAVVGLRRGVRVERVGLDDVGAGLEVAAVDLADHLRAREHEQVVVAFQVLRPVAEALAAVIRLAELVGLDDGAHGPVEHEDSLPEQAAEFTNAFGSQHGQASAAARAAGARTPSAWQIA